MYFFKKRDLYSFLTWTYRTLSLDFICCGTNVQKQTQREICAVQVCSPHASRSLLSLIESQYALCGFFYPIEQNGIFVFRDLLYVSERQSDSHTMRAREREKRGGMYLSFAPSLLKGIKQPELCLTESRSQKFLSYLLWSRDQSLETPSTAFQGVLTGNWI